ncbi:hypothetical protein [Dankookia rubra]|uniref:hypothetical protein n=1 Tax=Dankookia rubra TaxID=1442381 RepID=UPI00140D490D|nr:hypothetical protein [Dankookia rubra]
MTGRRSGAPRGTWRVTSHRQTPPDAAPAGGPVADGPPGCTKGLLPGLPDRVA